MKTVLVNLSFDSGNDNLPMFNVAKFGVTRHDNTTRSLTCQIVGGDVILPEGITITDNTLSSSDTDYIVKIKNPTAVTGLYLGSDFAVIPFEQLSLCTSLTSFKSRASASSGGHSSSYTGAISDLPKSLQIVWLGLGTGFTGTFMDFAEYLNLTDLGCQLEGEWLALIAKQISLGRTSGSIRSYYCTNTTFNGESLVSDRTLTWSNVSENVYSVTNATSSVTVNIQVNSDGSYIVVS